MVMAEWFTCTTSSCFTKPALVRYFSTSNSKLLSLFGFISFHPPFSVTNVKKDHIMFVGKCETEIIKRMVMAAVAQPSLWVKSVLTFFDRFLHPMLGVRLGGTWKERLVMGDMCLPWTIWQWLSKLPVLLFIFKETRDLTWKTNFHGFFHCLGLWVIHQWPWTRYIQAFHFPHHFLS